MAIAIATYNSTDIPKTCSVLSITNSTLSITDIITVTDINCTLNANSPDEGSGEDATLLEVTLTNPNGTAVRLQSFTGLPLTGIIFDTNRASYDSMVPFTQQSINGTWTLSINNFSSTAVATLNSWSIEISYDVPIVNAAFPGAPAAVTIPSGIKYGNGV